MNVYEFTNVHYLALIRNSHIRNDSLFVQLLVNNLIETLNYERR